MPTWVCSCEYSKSFRNSFFYRTTPVAAFELCFSIRKEFLKKKVSGEIAFELISLFHVQIQEPTSRSTTKSICYLCKIWWIFIITKYLKQEVNHNPRVFGDEHSPCGLSITGDKDLSMLHDQEVMALILCPIKFYHGVAFTGQMW